MGLNTLCLIDTHAHLDLDAFDTDRDELIRRCEQGIFPELKGRRPDEPPAPFSMRAVICPGITAASSERVVEICRSQPFLHPAVGIHPNDSLEASELDWKRIESLAELPEVVAIGETGLDLYWNDSPLERQKEFLIRHLELAFKRELPILIHCREAHLELIELLSQFQLDHDPNIPFSGVIHSFSGDLSLAQQYLKMGFYLSFSGSVTYTNKKNAPLREAASAIPNDRFLLETDSPFLTPHPFRGKLDRNEPLMTAFVARALAELRETTVAEIARQTTNNAMTLFHSLRDPL